MSKRLRLSQYNSIYLVLFILCLSAFVYEPQFFRAENINLMLRQSSALGILTIGHVFVISCGCIDLSVVATMQISIAMFMIIVKQYGEMMLFPGLVVSLLVVLLIGFINGVVVAKYKVQPFLSTLFIGIIITGIRKLVSGVTPLGAPPAVLINAIKGGKVISYSILWFAATALVAWFIMSRTVFGRNVMMVGTNVKAALFSGVPTERVVIFSYCICALSAMLAGIVASGYLGFADQTSIGNGMEMSSLAAAVLGGNYLSGGRASISGAVGGALAMTLMLSIVILFGLEIQYQHVLKGLVLLAVVAVSARTLKK